MEDLLECSVCMDTYQAKGPKTPKVLPCQHSYCVECLQSMNNYGYSITCPACRAKHYTRRPDELPNNLLLLQLLDWRPAERDTKKCQECQQQDAQTRVFCEKCLDERIEKEVIEAVCATTSIIKNIELCKESKNVGIQCDIGVLHCTASVRATNRRNNHWTILACVMFLLLTSSVWCWKYFTESECLVAMSSENSMEDSKQEYMIGTESQDSMYGEGSPGELREKSSHSAAGAIYNWFMSACAGASSIVCSTWLTAKDASTVFVNEYLSFAVGSFFHDTYDTVMLYNITEAVTSAFSVTGSSISVAAGSIYDSVVENAPIVLGAAACAVDRAFGFLWLIGASVMEAVMVYVPMLYTMLCSAILQARAMLTEISQAMYAGTVGFYTTYMPVIYTTIIYVLTLLYEALMWLLHFLFNTIVLPAINFAPNVWSAVYDSLSFVGNAASGFGEYLLSCIWYGSCFLLSQARTISVHLLGALYDMFMNQLGSAFEWVTMKPG